MVRAAGLDAVFVNEAMLIETGRADLERVDAPLGHLPFCRSGGFAGFSRFPVMPGVTRNREVL